MKLKNIGLFLLAILCLASCKDEFHTLDIDGDKVYEIPYEGKYAEVPVTAVGPWTAESDSSWCKIVTKEGQDYSTLVVNILGNAAGNKRSSKVTVKSKYGDTESITFNQEALPSDEILTYHLPVIFHVLYFDADDKQQNPDATTLYELLDKVNGMYKKASEGSPDMRVEFFPAQYNPKGQKLEEAGIERIDWMTPTIDHYEFMHSDDRSYVHLMWEPADYVNIFLYSFSDNGTLGISTFPVVPESHPLNGLNTVGDYDLSTTNLLNVCGISLNNYFIGDSHEIFEEYAPTKWHELIHKQNAPYITLAHELGHYLGLLHTFWYDPMGLFCMDTDMCEDTKYYDRQKYENVLSGYYNMIFDGSFNPDGFDWNSLFKRTSCSHEEFESHNIMDYGYGYIDEFSPQQYLRVRHVLNYAPLVPGAKIKAEGNTRAASPDNIKIKLDVSEGTPALR